MLRVTTLYAATAGATAACDSEYLSQAPGDVPGRWIGDIVEVEGFGLGVGDIVEVEQLRNLLEGRDSFRGHGWGSR